MENPPAWPSLLTIDLVAVILERSIFHWFIAWLIPLCLAGLATPVSSPRFRFSCLWAALVTLFHVCDYVSQRMAHGAPRKVEWENEVVVITGGASGLGRVLASMFGMKGVSVAVLDVQVPSEAEIRGDESLAEVLFYRCNVGHAEEVEEVKRRIEKDLGTPTILINNAAIVHGRNLLDLSSSQVETSLRVNILAHFNTIRTFLPGMLLSSGTPFHPDNTQQEADSDDDDDDNNNNNTKHGGTIVNISSVLGKLGAAQLSDYTASKAAVIAMHKSLEAEISLFSAASSPQKKINMILVTPGHLSTQLFNSISTPSAFFGPVVEPVQLARAIVTKIERGESGEISLPLYARHIEWLSILPVGIQNLLRRVSGVDTAMRGYTPRPRPANAHQKIP